MRKKPKSKSSWTVSGIDWTIIYKRWMTGRSMVEGGVEIGQMWAAVTRQRGRR